ncbi:hypothetical protein CCR82_11525 [Halochromatium salexigens]|uniref:Uncharacterized protein n=1 Tax=Halochromatium salexigens TaxID=49447 RepID=A0AAJ0UGN6_HALSE|nr:hypothetical protein [Halochromatium salexigens]
MALAEEDEWLADQRLGKPVAVYEIELRERMVRVEEELKHQRTGLVNVRTPQSFARSMVESIERCTHEPQSPSPSLPEHRADPDAPGGLG